MKQLLIVLSLVMCVSLTGCGGGGGGSSFLGSIGSIFSSLFGVGGGGGGSSSPGQSLASTGGFDPSSPSGSSSSGSGAGGVSGGTSFHDTAVNPEPATMVMMGSGLLAGAWLRRRQRRS